MDVLEPLRVVARNATWLKAEHWKNASVTTLETVMRCNSSVVGRRDCVVDLIHVDVDVENDTVIAVTMFVTVELSSRVVVDQAHMGPEVNMVAVRTASWRSLTRATHHTCSLVFKNFTEPSDRRLQYTFEQFGSVTRLQYTPQVHQTLAGRVHFYDPKEAEFALRDHHHRRV